MLQNLLCLWKKKTHVVFFVFHLEQLWILPYECPGLCDIDQGIHKGKMKVALNEKLPFNIAGTSWLVIVLVELTLVDSWWCCLWSENGTKTYNPLESSCLNFFLPTFKTTHRIVLLSYFSALIHIVTQRAKNVDFFSNYLVIWQSFLGSAKVVLFWRRIYLLMSS